MILFDCYGLFVILPTNKKFAVKVTKYEPVVEVYEAGKEKITYVKMTPEKAKEVVEKHFFALFKCEFLSVCKQCIVKRQTQFVFQFSLTQIMTIANIQKIFP